MCHAFHTGPTGVGDPNQLYFGENPDPEISTSNLSQPESGRLRWWLKFPSAWVRQQQGDLSAAHPSRAMRANESTARNHPSQI